MKKQMPLTWQDCLFLLCAAFFFFGCIASAHRSGKTLDQGQASFSGSYLRAENVDDPDAEPVQLIALDARVGVNQAVDLGAMHTWDITRYNENQFASFWGDFKVQVNNRENLHGMPIFSTGLIKGYVYDESADLHITGLPLIVSLPLNQNFTPYIMYRHELISDGFLPDDFDDPRSTFVLGTEVNLRKPTPKQWAPKVGLSIGTFNSLTGCEGDRGFVFNLGLGVDSPPKRP